MKIDHIIVYTDPRPSRVPLSARSGQKSSVTAAGTVPRMRPKSTMPIIRRLGVFRTRHHERTKSMTEENIQTKNSGAKYTYVGATRSLGPSQFEDIPSMIRFVPRTRYAQATNGR